MKYDDLDHLLSREEEIVPSSGFADAVMEAIRQQELTPPIPFPWKYALPGLTAGLALLVAFPIAALSHTLATPSAAASAFSPALAGVGWIFFTLLLSIASISLSRRLVH